MQWDVPVDDNRSLEFRLRRSPVTGAAARIFQRQRAAELAQEKASVVAFGDAVLSGKLRFQDLDQHFNDKIALIHTQDYIAQVGQGPIADRSEEHLGRSDQGIILFRKIWERELRAMAEGRPLKKWVLPQDVELKFRLETEQRHP